jgi:hypothetical protein
VSSAWYKWSLPKPSPAKSIQLRTYVRRMRAAQSLGACARARSPRHESRDFECNGFTPCTNWQKSTVTSHVSSQVKPGSCRWMAGLCRAPGTPFLLAIRSSFSSQLASPVFAHTSRHNTRNTRKQHAPPAGARRRERGHRIHSGKMTAYTTKECQHTQTHETMPA